MDIKEKSLKEAIRIGEEIIASSHADKSDLLWDTLNLDPFDHSVVWKKTPGIYTGNAGIVLFMLYLYSATADKKYLDHSIEAMERIKNKYKPSDYPSITMYGGMVGVVYTWVELYKITRNPEHLDNASVLAKECTNILKSSHNIVGDDILGGMAGILIGLLHLHQQIKQDWLALDISILTQRLLQNAFVNQQGVYWEKDNIRIQGLCGFSHGAAGVGYVLMEMANYFDEPALQMIAEQAFAYENNNWNEQFNNWPDFRKYLYKTPEEDLQYRTAYKNNDEQFFTKPKDTNAWCHGAAGIGLSRLHAYQITGKEVYKRDLDRAIEKTISSDFNDKNNVPSFTLCHARAGNTDFFIETQIQLGGNKFQQKIDSILNQIIEYKEAGKKYMTGLGPRSAEDTSLFLGNAGVGYFLLRAVFPNKIPSILCPRLDPNENGGKLPGKFELNNVNELFLKKSYYRTMVILEKINPVIYKEFLDRDDAFTNRNSFENFIKQVSKELPKDEKVRLLDVFNLEHEKLNMLNANKSAILAYITELYEGEKYQNILKKGEEAFLNENLVIPPKTTLIKVNWNWQQGTNDLLVKNLKEGPEEQWMFLQEKSLGVNEVMLPLIVQLILNECKKPIQTSKLVEVIVDEFEVENEVERSIVEEKIIQQLKEMLEARMLNICN